MSARPSPRVLMVDDEPNVLAAFRRALGRQYELATAPGGEEALRLIGEQDTFPVIVTDMRMPGMDGLEFIQRARKLSKDSIFMVLTGNGDQETAVRAINEGHIFRFLTKPCSPDMMQEALRAGLRQYELVTAERVLLHDTLHGSIRLLVEALFLSDPVLADMMTSISRTIEALRSDLGLEAEWRYPFAGSMCLLGVLVISDTEGDGWQNEEYLETCAHAADRLLRNIPRLEQVAEMIGRQREWGGLPEKLDTTDPGTRATIGARLLRFAVDLERFSLKYGRNREKVDGAMKAAGHDPRLYPAMERLLPSDTPEKPDNIPSPSKSRAFTREPQFITQTIRVRSLRVAMTIAQDVVTSDSKLLLGKGQVLTPVLIERLRSLARAHFIEETIDVFVPMKEKTDKSTPDAPHRKAG